MALRALDHVNIRTADLKRAVAWYTDALGLHSGPRPDFSFDGAWMYLGDQAVVHLVAVDAPPNTQDPRLEHFALSAGGLGEFLARLEAHGTEFQLAPVPEAGIIQVNIHDPDGNHIHVDFPTAEAEALNLL